MGKLNCRLQFQMVTTGKNVFEMPESVNNLKSSEDYEKFAKYYE